MNEQRIVAVKHAAEKLPGNWRATGLVIGRIAVFLACFVRPSHADETIYDNSDRVVVNGGTIFPTQGDWLFAQPIELGEHDNISKIELGLERWGSPTGTIEFSLWDDNGNGLPNQQIAELGTVNVSTLLTRDVELDGHRPFTKVAFETVVDGLEPNETYYLFGDAHDVSNGSMSEGNTIVWSGIHDDGGTNGADHIFVAKPFVGLDNLKDSDWVTLGSFGIGDRWMQMLVESATSGIADTCNLNADALCNVADIDLLTAEIAAAPPHDLTYDLSGDGVVDDTDLTSWLSDAATLNGFAQAYSSGDSNLDGSVNATDLNNLALNWQQSVSAWSGGDFTADGTVNAADLNALALNWQHSIAPVPEPSAAMLMVLGLVAFIGFRNMQVTRSGVCD